MYVGRDIEELTMMPKNEWKDDELAYFHKTFQQTLPYLNAEGQSLYREIIEEIIRREGFQKKEATYTSGTKISYD